MTSTKQKHNKNKNSIISNKPNIYLLAYGGTIACISNKSTDEFYNKPNLDIQNLIYLIPDIAQKANIRYEQVAQMLSQEMTEQDLLNLAKKIDQILKKDDVDGIIIIQGTDCIEEVAYFVNLVVNTNKPIVFTGAMRPSNSLGFDGFRNIYNAILIANSVKAKKIGAVLTFNDFINSARDAVKKNPSSISALSSEDVSMLGSIQGDNVLISRVPNFKHSYKSDFNINKISTLPKVYVIYGHLGTDAVFVDAAVANGAVGIVSAGVGKGYQTPATTEALAKAASKGVVVVRCSRTGDGYISRDPKLDDPYGFIAGSSLSPQKARILLMLALIQTKDKDTIQNYFYEY